MHPGVVAGISSTGVHGVRESVFLVEVVVLAQLRDPGVGHK